MPGAAFGDLLKRRTDAAERFNEHGLFGRAHQWLTARSLGSPLRTAPPGAAPADLSASLEGRLPPTGSDQSAARACATAAQRAERTTQPQTSADAASARSAPPSSLAPPPAMASVRGCDNPVRPADRAERHAARPRLADSRSARAGAADAIRLTAQAGSEGLRLVARVQGISGGERLRLRAAIEALLARSGLSAREIVINGESGPASGSGGE